MLTRSRRFLFLIELNFFWSPIRSSNCLSSSEIDSLFISLLHPILWIVNVSVKAVPILTPKKLICEPDHVARTFNFDRITTHVHYLSTIALTRIVELKRHMLKPTPKAIWGALALKAVLFRHYSGQDWKHSPILWNDLNCSSTLVKMHQVTRFWYWLLAPVRNSMRYP